MCGLLDSTAGITDHELYIIGGLIGRETWVIIPHPATAALSHEHPHAPSNIPGGRDHEYSGGRNPDKRRFRFKKPSKFACAENAILERSRVDTEKERIAVGQSSSTRGSSSRHRHGKPYPEVRSFRNGPFFLKPALYMVERPRPYNIFAKELPILRILY